MDKIELIDRTEVIEALEFSKTIRHMQDNVPLIDEFIGILNDAPLIDAAPVRRGEWVKNFETSAGVVDEKCSVCRSWFERPSLRSQYNFCPNCGADMRRVAIHEPED